jgi:acyl-CoA reductase-like NAD-dependent aldehyde dehydrogenase
VTATLPRADTRGDNARPTTHGNYIGGKWVPAASGKTFENRNPADTSDLIGTFADSGPEDAERAVQAAREAFPRWRAVPAPKRGEILYRAAELLVRRKEELSRDMTREMGKVLPETRST